ncbi:hypothetical protein LTR27_006587 [Elasticomyces elasticus]|nr:hypothetical protein LTR27_006587 [Elasticomyces elasticus]
MAKRAGEDVVDAVQKKKKRKTPQRKIKTITASTGKCMLPTIAPELRNKIYEMVLLEDHDIVIDKKLRVPALLQVCRRVRTETVAMWYERNNFDLTIKHCNAELLLRFEKLAMKTSLVNTRKLKVTIALKGKPHWSNLLSWCKAVCLAKAPMVDKADGEAKLSTVVAGALSLATRFGNPLRTWSRCEKALEDFRFVVGRFDPRWLK